MCGIAGILKVWTPAERELALRTPHGQSIPESWLDILDDSIKHRGPDGQGRFRDRAIRADGCVVDVALVHRRLSIIDHAGGHQPMVWGRWGGGTGILPVADVQRYTARAATQDWSDAAARPTAEHGQDARATDCIAVVFNGCIYNHRELRAELQRAGHVFSTDHSDTEVLVHGWREWGDALRYHLDGMYALAIWDRASASIAVLRDDFGEKPLYTAEFGAIRVFASTPTALLRVRSGIGRHAPDAFDPHLWLPGWVQFGWNQAGPWNDIRSEHVGMSSRLGHPGHASGEPWMTSLNPSGIPLTPDAVDALVAEAVASRMEADVPTGCFLSGGIDSALIAAHARAIRPGIRTYTVRMPFPGFDESQAAAATAHALGVSHTVLDCHSSPASDLQQVITQLGLPFGDSSLLPALWVSRASRREVAVALAGDGGDEMFLGYQRHAALPWLHRFERLGDDVLESMSLLVGRGGSARSRREKAARLIDAARFGGYKELVAIFPSPLSWQLGLCRPGETGYGATHHFGMTTSAKADISDEFATTTALRFDRMFYLPEDLLRKTDTASMASALEVRAPFLQRELAKAAMNAPLSSLMPHGQRKGLLRQVARKYLPAEIVDRPKMGFAIPIGEWFRSDYGGLGTMLLDHLNSTEPFGPPSLGIDLNMKFIRQMLDEHLGTGPSGQIKRDHSQRLYMLLVLSIWAKWMGSLR